MAYEAFDISSPVATQTAVSAMDSTRKNLNALRDGVVLGTFKAWNMSVGAPRSQPTSVLFSKGDERLKMAINYGSTGVTDGLPNIMVHTYSSNAASTYITVGTETITYDASGNVQAIAWS